MTKKIHEFRINDYLLLRLYKNDWDDCDNGEIIIYVSGDQFMQCRFLLLNIDVEEISTLDEIEKKKVIPQKTNNLLKDIEYDTEVIKKEICENLDDD